MKNIPKIFKILLPILSLFGAICMNTKVGRELIGSFLEALAENRFTAQVPARDVLILEFES
jgi:hypothetical protein